MYMRKFFVILALILFSAAAASAQTEVACEATYGDGATQFILATGSPGELGLLEALANAFNAKNGTKLCWVKAGSGASLKLLKAKKADMVMVHAPAAEKKAVEDGWASKRSLIGSNEFYIVGPKADPAGIAKSLNAADAYAKIAQGKALFFSRGDNSGTHKKELAVWEKAGITPEGDWYKVTKDFMMATLKKANDEGGYFMTDSSTWVQAKKDMPNLAVLYKGDPMLINTYHALAVGKPDTPGEKAGAAFIEFVASPDGQKIIAEYGAAEHGEALYNDAAYAKQYDH